MKTINNIKKIFIDDTGILDKSSYLKFINCKYDSFDEYITSFGPFFSRYIYNNLQAIKNDGQIKFHNDIYKYLFDHLDNYYKNLGKIHRPLLCILSFLACSKKVDWLNDNNKLNSVLPIACSIEHFQSAVLIHDDIADRATLRRGKPCLHKVLGDGLAINIGDFGLSLVIENILIAKQDLDFSSDKILEIINLLIKMEYITIQGQAMDLGWSKDKRFDISESDYFCMANKKTAYYSAAIPCMLGAVCAKPSKNIIRNLEIFGQKVGLAFQIKDDLLNIIDNGSDYSKQKDFRSDITEGKRTLILVKTLEMASKKDVKLILDVLQSNCVNKEKLQLVVNIMQKCGAIDYSIRFANNLCKDALSYLDVVPNSQWKNILMDFSTWVINRFI